MDALRKLVREVWIDGPKRTLSHDAYEEYLAELEESAKFYREDA